jgi:hypothetical protein
MPPELALQRLARATDTLAVLDHDPVSSSFGPDPAEPESMTYDDDDATLCPASGEQT